MILTAVQHVHLVVRARKGAVLTNATYSVGLKCASCRAAPPSYNEATGV